ncbi:unnamed protein product [Notodromas monacha]|uniref:Calcyclin-binding protein n=1 Tax=Notodromas monacha TaxID=399045 RepID=A0A7R9GBF4_9CRUS|nr:unnamed protein product [Notodromas monacha]CAG0914754.1 unnamed protein product [Notodromas monacha]
MIMASLSEMEKDIAELKLLLDGASRMRIKNILQSELTKARAELESLQRAATRDASSKEASSLKALCTVKLTNYAWDQTDKSVKIYLTNLPGIGDLPADSVSCGFEDRSVNVLIKGLNDKNYSFSLLKLLEEIKPSQSSFKVKESSVILTMPKKISSRWAHLLFSEKKAEDKRFDMPDADEDPSASLMKLMKKMYDEGDDEMKRTLTKSWYESQNKQDRPFGV